MALQGTGSAVNGWTRPFYLPGPANYPITISAWVKLPASTTNSSGFFGLTSANAMAFMLYYGSDIGGPNSYWFDLYDDTGAASTSGHPVPKGTPSYVSDGNWHHVGAQIFTTVLPPPGGQGGFFWFDGVRQGDTSAGLGLGAQTFTALQIGVAPADGTEPVFRTDTALAEVCVFQAGPSVQLMDKTMAALAQGASPLRTPGKRLLKAYHPLRNNFQDFGTQRVGFSRVGSPGDPVWVWHPPIDAPLVSFRRLPATHAAVALPGVGASTDSGSGVLSTAVVAVGTGSSTDTAIGDLLASSLQGSPTLSSNSGIGSLISATHLDATGSSSDSGLAALSGTGIFLTSTGLAISNDAGLGSLTVPSIAANAQQLQNALIDSVMRGQPFQPPSTWYIALVTQLGDTITPGLEVSGGSYARASIPASLAAWSGTQGQSTTQVSSGLSGLVSNNQAIVFPQATAGWGTIVGYEFWDAPSGGNRWLSGKLSTAVAVLNGQTRQFPIASLSIAQG